MLKINRDVASQLGSTPAAIDSVLYDALGQPQISQLFTPLNQYFAIIGGESALSAWAGSSGSGPVADVRHVPLSEQVTQQTTVAPLRAETASRIF
jgi:multidrug efflux pump subunit AcrB